MCMCACVLPALFLDCMLFYLAKPSFPDLKMNVMLVLTHAPEARLNRSMHPEC